MASLSTILDFFIPYTLIQTCLKQAYVMDGDRYNMRINDN